MNTTQSAGPVTWVTRIALLLVLCAVAFAVAVLVVLPRATHGAALTVLTGSMTPRIPVGSVVVERPVDPGTLRIGDIATYQKTPGKSEFITHRIVAINMTTSPITFVFKGDANRGPDATPVPATAIRGKVWFHVPYLGAIRDSLRTKGGLEGVAMLALLAFAAYQIRGWLADRRTGSTVATQPGVLLQLPIAAFGGLSAAAVARLLGGTVERADGAQLVVRLAATAVVAESALATLRRTLGVELSALTSAGEPALATSPAPLASGLTRLRHGRLATAHA